MILFHLIFWTVAPWNMPQKNPGVQSKSKFQYIHFFWHRIALGYAKFFLCFVSGKKCQIWPKMEHKEAQVYSAGAKYCDLCLTEKTIIMLADKNCINIQSKTHWKCPHQMMEGVIKLFFIYPTPAIITRSWFETALNYKPQILGPTFLVYVFKWSVILNSLALKNGAKNIQTGGYNGVR